MEKWDVSYSRQDDVSHSMNTHTRVHGASLGVPDSTLSWVHLDMPGLTDGRYRSWLKTERSTGNMPATLSSLPLNMVKACKLLFVAPPTQVRSLCPTMHCSVMISLNETHCASTWRPPDPVLVGCRGPLVSLYGIHADVSPRRQSWDWPFQTHCGILDITPQGIMRGCMKQEGSSISSCFFHRETFLCIVWIMPYAPAGWSGSLFLFSYQSNILDFHQIALLLRPWNKARLR